MFVHKYDKRNAASIDNKAERLFVAIAGSRGYKVRPSNLNQNKINKVDFFLEKNSVIKGVDVKGQKKYVHMIKIIQMNGLGLNSKMETDLMDGFMAIQIT